jgi:hypothetical protein
MGVVRIRGSHLLPEGDACRGGHHQPGFRRGAGHRVERLAPGAGGHDHSWPAAKGRVIHGAVGVVRPRAQVVHLELDDAALDRPAEQ